MFVPGVRLCILRFCKIPLCEIRPKPIFRTIPIVHPIKICTEFFLCFALVRLWIPGSNVCFASTRGMIFKLHDQFQAKIKQNKRNLNQVYSKNYANGCSFVVLCGVFISTYLPTSFKVISLELVWSYDRPSTSEGTLKNMNKSIAWIH